MAIAQLSNFPASFVAGDTINIKVGSVSYPAANWTMKVLMTARDGRSVTFDASADVDNLNFDILIQTAGRLTAGQYALYYVFSNDITSERYSLFQGWVTVLPDLQKALPKSVARQTLEAMQTALREIAGGTNFSVSFNGQTFTTKNLSALQDAIDRQELAVNAEEIQLGLPNRFGARRIGVRFR